MKKIFTIIIIFIGLAAGYLYYDWNAKTKKQEVDPSKTVYSWTDEKGVKHFTDKKPPSGAKNIKETKGFRYTEPPLVLTIKESMLSLYSRIKYAVSDVFRYKKKKRPKKNRK